ncbi:unnamed protein product [Gordionus sp. m RMFG-2023]
MQHKFKPDLKKDKYPHDIKCISTEKSLPNINKINNLSKTPHVPQSFSPSLYFHKDKLISHSTTLTQMNTHKFDKSSRSHPSSSPKFCFGSLDSPFDNQIDIGNDCESLEYHNYLDNNTNVQAGKMHYTTNRLLHSFAYFRGAPVEMKILNRGSISGLFVSVDPAFSKVILEFPSHMQESIEPASDLDPNIDSLSIGDVTKTNFEHDSESFEDHSSKKFNFTGDERLVAYDIQQELEFLTAYDLNLTSLSSYPRKSVQSHTQKYGNNPKTPFMIDSQISEKNRQTLYNKTSNQSLKAEIIDDVYLSPLQTSDPSSDNSVGTKELQPWRDDDEYELEGVLGKDDSLLTGTPIDNQDNGGWQVEEMFATNELRFGLHSTYTEDLPDYTTRLEVFDTPEYKEREARATRLAAEIESNSAYQKRVALENDDNERELEDTLSNFVTKSPILGVENSLKTQVVTGVGGAWKRARKGTSDNITVSAFSSNNSLDGKYRATVGPPLKFHDHQHQQGGIGGKRRNSTTSKYSTLPQMSYNNNVGGNNNGVFSASRKSKGVSNYQPYNSRQFPQTEYPGPNNYREKFNNNYSLHNTSRFGDDRFRTPNRLNTPTALPLTFSSNNASNTRNIKTFIPNSNNFKENNQTTKQHEQGDDFDKYYVDISPSPESGKLTMLASQSSKDTPSKYANTHVKTLNENDDNRDIKKCIDVVNPFDEAIKYNSDKIEAPSAKDMTIDASKMLLFSDIISATTSSIKDVKILEAEKILKSSKLNPNAVAYVPKSLPFVVENKSFSNNNAYANHDNQNNFHSPITQGAQFNSENVSNNVNIPQNQIVNEPNLDYSGAYYYQNMGGSSFLPVMINNSTNATPMNDSSQSSMMSYQNYVNIQPSSINNDPQPGHNFPIFSQSFIPAAQNGSLESPINSNLISRLNSNMVNIAYPHLIHSNVLNNQAPLSARVPQQQQYYILVQNPSLPVNHATQSNNSLLLQTPGVATAKIIYDPSKGPIMTPYHPQHQYPNTPPQLVLGGAGNQSYPQSPIILQTTPSLPPLSNNHNYKQQHDSANPPTLNPHNPKVWIVPAYGGAGGIVVPYPQAAAMHHPQQNFAVNNTNIQPTIQHNHPQHQMVHLHQQQIHQQQQQMLVRPPPLPMPSVSFAAFIPPSQYPPLPPNLHQQLGTNSSISSPLGVTPSHVLLNYNANQEPFGSPFNNVTNLNTTNVSTVNKDNKNLLPSQHPYQALIMNNSNRPIFAGSASYQINNNYSAPLLPPPQHLNSPINNVVTYQPINQQHPFRSVNGQNKQLRYDEKNSVIPPPTLTKTRSLTFGDDNNFVKSGNSPDKIDHNSIISSVKNLSLNHDHSIINVNEEYLSRNQLTPLLVNIQHAESQNNIIFNPNNLKSSGDRLDRLDFHKQEDSKGSKSPISSSPHSLSKSSSPSNLSHNVSSHRNYNPNQNNKRFNLKNNYKYSSASNIYKNSNPENKGKNLHPNLSALNIPHHQSPKNE